MICLVFQKFHPPSWIRHVKNITFNIKFIIYNEKYLSKRVFVVIHDQVTFIIKNTKKYYLVENIPVSDAILKPCQHYIKRPMDAGNVRFYSFPHIFRSQNLVFLKIDVEQNTSFDKKSKHKL